MLRRFTERAKVFMVFAIICLTAVSMCSCEHNGGNLFSYQKESFSLLAEGTVDGIAIKATVHFESRNDEANARVMTVSYLSPESLEGITVTLYSDGTSRSRLGNVEIGGSFHGFATPFLAICPEGEYSSLSFNDKGDATVIFDDGDKNVKYYFENGKRLPVKIEGRVSGRQVSLRLSEK